MNDLPPFQDNNIEQIYILNYINKERWENNIYFENDANNENTTKEENKKV